MVIKKIWGLLYSELIKAILSKYPWLKHLLWQCSGSCVGRTTKLPFNVAMSKRPLTTTVPLQSCAKAGAKAVAWGESTQVKACMAIQRFLLLYLNTLLKSKISKFYIVRFSQKWFYYQLKIFKKYEFSQNLEGVAQKLCLPRPFLFWTSEECGSIYYRQRNDVLFIFFYL